MSSFYHTIPSLLQQLQAEALQFEGGRLQQFYAVWEILTSDPEILQLVRGAHLEFDDTEFPSSSSPQPHLNKSEMAIIDSEIVKLSRKKVISKCEHSPDQYLSPVFTRPKKDGTNRMILNLKGLNSEITYHHFKMDTLQVALKLVTPFCFMSSIDLKDAYYSVPIAKHHRKFLRFSWRGQLWQFDCMPNGLALAPRKFTKLLKPVLAKLREEGHVSTSFLDDSLLLSDSEEESVQNVQATVQLFRSLGFIIHPDKSVLEPTQQIQYLGVVIDSRDMSVRLTAERKCNLKDTCNKLLKARKLTIRDLAKVIGKVVASFTAVKYGPLYYRHLEENKKAALLVAKGDYDSPVSITFSARTELHWWVDNATIASNDITPSDPDITVASDASISGWGCVCQEDRSGGLWLPAEASFHINYLELKAAFFALQCFETKISNKHARLLLDNSTAVACINNMGTSHSVTCNQMAFSIWLWCRNRHVWVSAAHIPGKENTAADAESRKINLDAEWKLDKAVLEQALAQLQASPSIDLFASRLNNQRSCYVSYRADPEAHAVDAFSLSWTVLEFYAFPPFSLITRVLQKVKRDRSTGVIIVPTWPTQVWWPVLMKMITGKPVQLASRVTLLTLPSHPEKRHRLLPRLKLLACKISGAGTNNRDTPGVQLISC